MKRALALTLALALWAPITQTPAQAASSASTASPSSENLAQQAREARRQGRLLSASWALERALSAPTVSELALEEAERFGWEVHAVEPPTTLASPWPWWLIGLGAWLALLAAAWARRERVTLIALVLAPLVSWLALPSSQIARPSLPAALGQAFDASRCDTPALYWEDGRVVIEARCDGQDARWRITRGQAGAAFAAQTEHHQLGGGSALSDVAFAQDLERKLLEALVRSESEGYRVPLPEAWSMPRMAKWAGADPLERARLQVSAGVVFAALMVLLSGLFLMAVQFLSEGPYRAVFITLLVLSALALVLTEGRMRMMYSGYHLTESLIEGSLPRYGPGAIWFYGPVQWLLGGDHAWVQWMNRIYGLGCGVAVVLLANIWFDRGVALITACLASALPFFLFAYSCESIHVAPSFAFLVAIAMVSRGASRALVAPLLCALAAALTRPEIAVLMCLAPVWLWLILGRPRVGRGSWPWLLALVVGYALIGLRMSEILGLSDQLAAQGAVASSGRWLERGWYAMSLGGVFLNPSYLPSALLPLLLVAAFHPKTRALALPTFAFGMVWLASAGIDYAFVSLIRLQLPVVLLWLPLMAAAAVVVYRWRFGAILSVTLALWMLVGVGISYRSMDTWTVEDDEDLLWRDAVEALPEGPGCLLSHSYGDESTQAKTPRFVPAYLLNSKRPQMSLHPLRMRSEVSRTCPGPVYVLRGSRCYAELRRPGEPAPPQGTDYCEKSLSGASLTPLFERDVPNVGVPSYPMYPADERLRFGLYRYTP